MAQVMDSGSHTGRRRRYKKKSYAVKPKRRSARYNAAMARKRRRTKYRPHPQAGRGRQPHSGYKGGKVYRVVGKRPSKSKPSRSSGKSYKSKTRVRSTYSPPRTTPPAPKAKPKPPPPPQATRRIAWFDALGHYRIRNKFDSDATGEPGLISDPPYDPGASDPGEYGEYFDTEYPSYNGTLQLDLTDAQLQALVRAGAIERYKDDGTAYYETTFDLENVDQQFSQVQIKISKVL